MCAGQHHPKGPHLLGELRRLYEVHLASERVKHDGGRLEYSSWRLPLRPLTSSHWTMTQKSSAAGGDAPSMRGFVPWLPKRTSSTWNLHCLGGDDDRGSRKCRRGRCVCSCSRSVLVEAAWGPASCKTWWSSRHLYSLGARTGNDSAACGAASDVVSARYESYFSTASTASTASPATDEDEENAERA